MSANTARPCKHCGQNVVPNGHMCRGKIAAIEAAREQHLTRASRRLRQRWHDNNWIKVVITQ